VSHRVEISGPLSAVRFPSLCASCAATPPAGALPLVRMFRHVHHESPTTYTFAEVRVPFCAACLARHERDRPPVDPAVLRGLRWRWLFRVLPYAFPLAVLLFLLTKLGPLAARTLRDAAMHPRATPSWEVWAVLGIVGFFLLCLYGFVSMSIAAGRPLIAHRLERDANANDVVIVPGMLGSQYVIPTPPTPTLAAVRFADEDFQLFEANKRAFTFEHPVVAEQFAALNADRVWTPDAPQAVRGARRRYAAVVAVIVVGGLYILWEVLMG